MNGVESILTIIFKARKVQFEPLWYIWANSSETVHRMINLYETHVVSHIWPFSLPNKIWHWKVKSRSLRFWGKKMTIYDFLEARFWAILEPTRTWPNLTLGQHYEFLPIMTRYDSLEDWNSSFFLENSRFNLEIHVWEYIVTLWYRLL